MPSKHFVYHAIEQNWQLINLKPAWENESHLVSYFWKKKKFAQLNAYPLLDLLKFWLATLWKDQDVKTAVRENLC